MGRKLHKHGFGGQIRTPKEYLKTSWRRVSFALPPLEDAAFEKARLEQMRLRGINIPRGEFARELVNQRLSERNVPAS